VSKRKFDWSRWFVGGWACGEGGAPTPGGGRAVDTAPGETRMGREGGGEGRSVRGRLSCFDAIRREDLDRRSYSLAP